MSTDAVPALPPSPAPQPPAPAPVASRLSKQALAALILAVPGLAIPLLAPVAIVLAIVALRQTGRDPALKGGGLAIGGLVCGVIGLLTSAALTMVALFALRFAHHGPARISGIIEKELKYFDYKMQYLAQHLAEQHPGEKYLLITNQRSENTAKRHDVMMAALKPLNIVKVQEVLPPEEMGTEVVGGAEVFLTAEKLDALIEANPECTMVISTMGLPMDYQRMKFWRKKPAERPKLVLVDAYVWDLKKAIQVGAIAAVVQYRPDATYAPNEDVPDNAAEAFHKRFILITPQNVDEMDKKYAGLFMEEPQKKP